MFLSNILPKLTGFFTMITIKPSVRYLDDQYNMLKGHSGMESKSYDVLTAQEVN